MKLAFLGGGLRSAVGYTHFVASRMDGRWSLEAGAFSSDPETNTASAQRYGVPKSRTYGAWSELLAQEAEQLDAVVILTPPGLHQEMICGALEAGLAVICEKPLAALLVDAEKVRNRLEATNGFLALTYNYSGYPMLRQLRRMIAEDHFGTIRQIQMEMPQEGFIRTDPAGKPITPQAWRLVDQEVPTVYLDLGSHLHHLAYFLTGQKPVSVLADAHTFGKHPVIVDDMVYWVNYSEGLKVRAWISKAALGSRNGLTVRVFGEKASARWVQAYPEDLYLAYADGSASVLERGANLSIADAERYTRFKAGHPAGFVEAFGNLYYDIADSLKAYQQGGEYLSDYVYGLDHAVEGLQLAKAATLAAETGRWCEIC
jgi:predicted dehydrogenase